MVFRHFNVYLNIFPEHSNDLVHSVTQLTDYKSVSLKINHHRCAGRYNCLTKKYLPQSTNIALFCFTYISYRGHNYVLATISHHPTAPHTIQNVFRVILFSIVKLSTLFSNGNNSDPQPPSQPSWYMGTRLLTWINNHMFCKVWDEITYPFQNINGATVEVQEWINKFIPHTIMDVFTYPCWD